MKSGRSARIGQEVVMAEADMFGSTPKRALRSSSKSTSESEKRTLMNLACTLGASGVDGRETVWVEPYFVAEA
jgi:hypothetical protein